MAAAPVAGRVVALAIERLGAQGDGLARLDGETVRVPLALPGERWEVRLEGRRRGGWDSAGLRCLEPAPRALPACRHFGVCGGCRLQHLPPDLYAAFGRARIADALARRGLPDVPIAPALIVPPGARRRLRLAWARHGRCVTLGLRARRTHRPVDLAECPVARPGLVALLPPLRALLAALDAAGPDGEALLGETAAGIDMLLQLARSPGRGDRERLAAFAHERDLARIAAAAPESEPEPVLVRREPVVDLAGARVAVPPGAFLQATEAGERALMAAVAAAVRPGDRVLDLFAGLGALGLAALEAGAAAAHAVEADPVAVGALAAAHRRHLSVERRDLARRPLLADELSRFDLVILDPPRAGAFEQVRHLAAAAPRRAVYAACDPESFARDARLLVDGGWRAGPVQPVAQFLWSAEIELVALLERPSGRGGRA